MAKANIISRHGFIVALRTGTREDYQLPVQRLSAALEGVLDQYRLEERRIQADHGLNATGKTVRLKTLRDQFLPRIDETVRTVCPGLPRLRRDAELLQERLKRSIEFEWTEARGFQPRTAANDLGKIALHREIRDRLQAKNSIERWSVACEAAQRGDHDTLQAIVAAPQSFPLLTAEQIDQVREVYVTKHHAATRAELQELEECVDVLTYNANFARGLITGEARARGPQAQHLERTARAGAAEPDAAA
jgi:hypothetical protein